jgi:hypothetical protein
MTAPRSRAALTQTWKGMAKLPRTKRAWPQLSVGQRVVVETAFREYEAKARRKLVRAPQRRDVVRTMAHQLNTGGHCPPAPQDDSLAELPEVVSWFRAYDDMIQSGSVNRVQARDRFRALIRDLCLESVSPSPSTTPAA